MIFKVSRSSYYHSLKLTRKALKDRKDATVIKEIHEKSPEYGYRRIAIAAGFSKNKTYRLMKKLNIKSKIRKRKYYRYPAAKKNIGIVSGNLVKREFKALKPLTQLHCDITQINTKSGQTSYVCGIIDVFNNEIVGYNISRKCDTKLVINAIQAIKDLHYFKNKQRIIIHTDQGIQFKSSMWHEKLKEYNIISSMSPKGSPVDNSPIESFFSTLKAEYLFLIDPKTAKELNSTLRDWIKYYNNERIVYKLKSSPINYRKNKVLQ